MVGDGSWRHRVSSSLRGGGSIAVGLGFMNVATYGFTIVAARVLGPRSYGALAGVMATLLVVGVLQLGLQATAARRISADPGHVAQIERSILTLTYRTAAGIGILMLVLAPLVNAALRLDNLITAVVLAVCVVPLTIMGGLAGILQGERRWTQLALLYAAGGVPRLVVGTALILWQPSELSALVGVTIGFLAPVAVGWWFLRLNREPGETSERHRLRPMVGEILHNSQALLALFALSNVDIIMARNLLSDHDSGLYAGGLILTKALLFLPQFVVVVAFPAMSTAAERRRALTRSLAIVAAIGAVGTIASAALSGLALVFVGGGEYDDVQGRLWMFAILGTVLSMLQLLVYSVLARQGQHSVYLVWIAFVTLIGLGLLADSIDQLLVTVLAIDGALFAVLLGLSLVLVRQPLQPDEDAAGVPPASV
ncbi:Membrane protein involved in the export of O-antigen and teichoic acid [Nocardioides szechwanensis]|uniref:Membrane protein involved in the export of O-antigen and teichoic acid n=1 Tax=Nocardioides szechwanensis TaxID=1005944 RepID=A0A1G9VQ95_9ACTN|nr:oligosaccharide flippase family protein [Nocardioides szechwanensis]SDM74263.1 Membrane protein involved in the export of O-antigen and teichoic acid [Nocardioides szechwanensis]